MFNLCFNSSYEGVAIKIQTKWGGKTEQGSGMSWLEGRGTVKTMAHFLGTENLKQNENLLS